MPKHNLHYYKRFWFQGIPPSGYAKLGLRERSLFMGGGGGNRGGKNFSASKLRRGAKVQCKHLEGWYGFYDPPYQRRSGSYDPPIRGGPDSMPPHDPRVYSAGAPPPLVTNNECPKIITFLKFTSFYVYCSTFIRV